MSDEKELQRALDAYNRELRKDHIEIQIDKQKFAKQVKNGLGAQMSDYNTYIKKEPSLYQRIKAKINRFFKYI